MLDQPSNETNVAYMAKSQTRAFQPTQKMYPLGTTFGITTNLKGDDISRIQVPGFADHPDAAEIDPNYVFEPDTFCRVMFFFQNDFGSILTLTGQQGAGKSSLPRQISARLRLPLTEITAHERMIVDQLLVTYVADGKGAMMPIDGPLTKALREGHIFILNEPDSMPPGERLALNQVRDNGNLSVPQLSETIRRHPGFRLIYTQNTKGSGDQSGLFMGTKRQNASGLEGLCLEVSYPKPEIEQAILANVAAAVPAPVREKMVEGATKLRALNTGNGPKSISVPLSTRTLILWALTSLQYANSPKPLAEALNYVYANRLTEEEKEAVHGAMELVFGTLWQ